MVTLTWIAFEWLRNYISPYLGLPWDLPEFFIYTALLSKKGVSAFVMRD